ncbi:BRO family protein [Phytopseudomonas dryadis]|nr:MULTISPECIES: Bro-N domain-containing protein [Pseudomonas]
MRPQRPIVEGHALEDHEITLRYATDGQPWFDAEALCTVLEYPDWQSALLEYCRPEGILFGSDTTPQAMINLENLQRLSAHGTAPGIRRLRNWLDQALRQCPAEADSPNGASRAHG